MSSQNTISKKMEKIKTLFQESSDFAFATDDLKRILSQINNSENEFRSVAFEATAMVFAEKDILDNKSLNRWKQFLLEEAGAHSSQVHVGLGWAFAKHTIDIQFYIGTVEPFMISSVLDGIGYYDGIFKQRQSINSKKISDKIDLAQLRHYDQGIGRSIWYSCLGNIPKVKEVIDSFPSARHADLWRGIGIAFTYVGGFDERMMNEINSIATEHRSQLYAGAAFAAKGRAQSSTINPETELVCRSWFNLSANQTVDTIDKLLKDSKEKSYDLWLSAIEKQLISSSEIKI
ncbi:MAG: DUF1702 family protein [Bacteroidetes bacterium]|nr:DUF1702 family protein [Bacteroidota bacterium]